MVVQVIVHNDCMKQQQGKSNDFESITLIQRTHYGCLAKIFCCKCIHCCQDLDISLLTSGHRKQLFQKMIKRYVQKLHRHSELSVIMDPFFILVALLLGEESEIYTQLMGIINNQSEPTVFSKEDLEFYIPELCTYLVFHEELKNMELQKLLVRACKVDIHFSLKYYFYMKSLEIISNGEELTKYEGVTKYNEQFRSMINRYYQAHKTEREFASIINPQLMKPEEDGSIVLSEDSDGEDKENVRATYDGMCHSTIIVKNRKLSLGEKEEQTMSKQVTEKNVKVDEDLKQKIKINKIRFLKQATIYQPFISKPMDFPKGLFQSTVNFFSDLTELSRILVSSPNRKEELQDYLQRVNKRLPATIYIPFTKDCYQDLNIVNIIVSEARVFNTKERAPYYICLESFYNPTYNEGISRDKKIRSAIHIKRDHFKKPHLFEDDLSPSRKSGLRQSQIHLKLQKERSEFDEKSSVKSGQKGEKKSIIKNWSAFFNLNKIKKKIMKEKNEEEGVQECGEEYQQEEEQEEESKSQTISENGTKDLVADKKTEESMSIVQLFGQSEEKQFQKISQVSPYSDLPGYKLIHIIIKSNDDLRQECFAMQLLQQFQKIFKMEHLPVKLLPYEVLPLSHEAGIIECVKDAITIDELRKKGSSLAVLLNTKAKKKNFMYSLVGYSLVTYFLQVKDRHNGNIMIRSDGSILHIDYGFFMTNMPGKGVQLQKNLPFKLTNQYVQVLDGVKSKTFQKFRLLFYKAFNACRKHQHRIIILTKLMYSSYGKTMPCFVKGKQSIQKLQERFNPAGITNDAEMSVYCQNLINSSIDNWRSRWYDKWQYYMQGILY